MKSPGNVSEAVYNILRVILGSGVIMGTIENALIILAIVTTKKLRIVPNVYLVNLAVVDFMMCAYVMPMFILGYSGLITSEMVSCKIAAYLTVVSMTVTFTSLASVAFNRYMIICRPRVVYDKVFTPRNVALSVVVLWLIPMILAGLPLYVEGDDFWGEYTYNNKMGGCFFSSSPSSYTFSFIITDGILFWPCNILIIVSYYKIWRKFQKSRQNLVAPDGKTPTTNNTASSVSATVSQGRSNDGQATQVKLDIDKDTAKRRRERKMNMALVKNLVVIWLVFMATCTPIVLLHKSDVYGAAPNVLYHIFITFGQMNSVMNFFIYATMNTQIRDAYIRLVTCGRRGRDSLG